MQQDRTQHCERCVVLVAANLAQHGFKVLLIEAGGDLMDTADEGRLLYSTPAFHGLCSEDKRCSWDYFVHHYRDPSREKLDSKYDLQGGGIWYPRVGALGGCTVHNAMITVTPQAIDWDMIRLRVQTGGFWSESRTLHLNDPLQLTRQQVGRLFGRQGTCTARALLEALQPSSELAAERPVE